MASRTSEAAKEAEEQDSNVDAEEADKATEVATIRITIDSQVASNNSDMAISKRAPT